MEQIVLQLKNSHKRRLLMELHGELDFVKVRSVITCVRVRHGMHADHGVVQVP